MVTTVADTEDPSDGLSLREAMNAANANPGMDTIEFDIDGPAPHVIAVGSGTPAGTALPDLHDPVVIDGTTNPDYVDFPVVVLDGTYVSEGFDKNGLFLNALATGSASNSQIRGLLIKNFPAVGILVYTSNNLIDGNSIVQNKGGIILSFVDSNQILNNLIAGNHGDGIFIAGFENLVGSNNRVQNNSLVGNEGDGVYITGSQSLVLDNVISSNTGNGVAIISYWAISNIVQGNFIGTDENGADLGNGQHGVQISGDSRLNEIGGFAFSGRGGRNIAANVIAFNGGDGVRVLSGIRNTIQGNSIFKNDGLGIDLGGDGVTPNDLHNRNLKADTDFGANFLQNFPKIVLVQTVGDTTTVRMKFASNASNTFEIDLYVSDEADPSGYGEGQTYLKTINVTTTPNPSTLLIFVTLPAVGAGKFITATATNGVGNTSEFSNAFEAPRPVAARRRTPPVGHAPSPPGGNRRQPPFRK